MNNFKLNWQAMLAIVALVISRFYLPLTSTASEGVSLLILALVSAAIFASLLDIRHTLATIASAWHSSPASPPAG
jgi:hypothetical protein